MERIEVKVVAAQLGDVHQTIDVEAVERHEQAEMRDAADSSFEGLSDPILHVVALEPALDVARRVIGTALGLRTMLAELRPGRAAGLLATTLKARLDAVMKQ